jgi:hypothetical protein
MAGLTAGGALRALLVPAFILCGAGTSPRALGQGATDYPIPSSAREAYSPIAEGFIQEALAEVMAEESARCEISADQLIAETAKLAFLNMMDYLRIGENGEPFVDLSALTRAQAAGLLAFKYKERKDGRGEDARDVAEVEIRLNSDKFRAIVKLGDRLGLWKPQGPAGRWQWCRCGPAARRPPRHAGKERRDLATLSAKTEA